MARGFWTALFDPAAAGPQIFTPRLLLRPLRLTDFAEWSALRRANAEALSAVEPRWHPQAHSYRLYQRRVSWTRQVIRQGRALPLLIFQHHAGQMIGGITLDHIRLGPNQSAEIGYWLGAAYQGQGFMHEALSAMLTHAEDQLNLSRIEAACLTENHASRKVLERCGFRMEGVAQRSLEINGQFRDHLSYAWLSASRSRNLND